MAEKESPGQDPNEEKGPVSPEEKVPATPAGGETEKLNLAGAPVRRRHMLGTEMSLAWDSYTAHGTSLCSQLVSMVSSEAGVSKQPERFNASRIKEHPGDIALQPTIEPDESTISARWSDDDRVHLYLERLLKVRPLAIPQGMRAYITVSRYESKNGPVIRLHLSEPRMAEIGSRARTKNQDGQGEQGSNSNSASHSTEAKQEKPDQDGTT